MPGRGEVPLLLRSRDFGIAETLDAFNGVTYFTEDKRYIAGSVRTYHLDGSREPVYGLQFYPQDLIREDD